MLLTLNGKKLHVFKFSFRNLAAWLSQEHTGYWTSTGRVSMVINKGLDVRITIMEEGNGWAVYRDGKGGPKRIEQHTDWRSLMRDILDG